MIKKISPETSVLLDFFRGFSAQLVLIGHLLAFFGIQQKYQLPVIQNFGVLVFFVLSGFLITQTTLIKGKEYGFSRFLIDRFSRIFFSFIPALVFVLLVDIVLISYGSYNRTFNNSVFNFVANTGMLHAFPFLKKFGIEAFGSGRPFWTVAVEWWLYIFFGFMFYICYAKQKVRFLHLLLFAVSVPLAFLFINSRGEGLTLVWFLGFILAILYNQTSLFVSRRTFLMAILLALTGIAYRTIYAREMYDLGIALFVGLAVFAMLHATEVIRLQQKSWDLFARFSKFLASYSFSLYLIHYTVIELCLVFFDAKEPAHLVIILVACNLIAYLFYLFFEKRNDLLKHYLRQSFIRSHR